MRGLVHAFVEPRIRVNLWKLFNDRLYCGQVAHDYLNSINSPLANSYSYCPICAGHVPATYKHLFWDCPMINSFWIIVQNLHQRMGSESRVNSYYDRATFIDRNHMNDIVMLMEDEMIYNTFDAAWCAHCHTLSTINDTSNPKFNRDEEWAGLIANYLHHPITHFNKSFFGKTFAFIKRGESTKVPKYQNTRGCALMATTQLGGRPGSRGR